MITAANSAKFVSTPQRPFYVYVSKFSRTEVGLPKHVIVSQTKEPPAVMHAIRPEPQRSTSLRTPEKDSQAYLTCDDVATCGI